MTTSEYIRSKNQIALDLVGVIITPENQIVDIEFHELEPTIGDYSCPYCQKYQATGRRSCRGCPMSEAGNECGISKDSTWYIFMTAIHKKDLEAAFKEAITPLVKEYNESNKKGIA